MAVNWVSNSLRSAGANNEHGVAPAFPVDVQIAPYLLMSHTLHRNLQRRVPASGSFMKSHKGEVPYRCIADSAAGIKQGASACMRKLYYRPSGRGYRESGYREVVSLSAISEVLNYSSIKARGRLQPRARTQQLAVRTVSRTLAGVRSRVRSRGRASLLASSFRSG